MIAPESIKSVRDYLGGGGALIAPLWNYLDAACSTMAGIAQLMDQHNHRSVTTQLKGTLNILSTAQVASMAVITMASTLYMLKHAGLLVSQNSPEKTKAKEEPASPATHATGS